MKKLLSLLFAAAVVFCFSFGAFAADAPELINAQNYYKSAPGLSTVEQVLATASLGLDPSNAPFVTYDVQALDYDGMYASDLAKEIISMTARGINPTEVKIGYDKKNLVALLESYVQADGQISKGVSSGGTPANFQIWPMFALYIVNSSYDKNKALQYLLTQQGADGSFGYTSASVYYPSPDITGWVLSYFSLIDVPSNYQANVDKALNYIKSTEKSDGSWGDWGASASTQACVISGLLAVDKANFLAGAYNKTQNPYDVLLSFQNAQGWFGYPDSNTFDGVYSTPQAAMTVGEMAYGNLFKRLNTKYKSIISGNTSPTSNTVNNTTNNTTNSTTNNSTDSSSDRSTTTTNTTDSQTTNNYYTSDPKVITVTNTKEIIREIAAQQAGIAETNTTPDNNISSVNPVINVTMPDYSDEIKYLLSLLTVFTGIYAIKAGVNLWRK